MSNKQPTYDFIEPSDLQSMMQTGKTRVIDVRDEDFTDIQIKGSTNVPSEIFAKSAPSLVSQLESDKIENVVFHCHYSKERGPRCASIFSDFISENSNVKIHVLRGGIVQWKQFSQNDPALFTKIK